MDLKRISRFYQRAKELPVEEKRAIMNLIDKSIAMFEKQWSVEQRYNVLLSIAESVLDRKLTKERTEKNTIIRMYVAYKMRLEGYRFEMIGKALKRHHASAMYLIKRMKNMLDVPKGYRKELADYIKFENAVNAYDKEHPVSETNPEPDDSLNPPSLGQA